jgi:hypothetical protein
MTKINGKITEPHDSASFGPVAHTFFCILDKNVDDDEATITCKVNVCDNSFKDKRDVAKRKYEASHVICVDDGEVNVPNFLVPFLYLN